MFKAAVEVFKAAVEVFKAAVEVGEKRDLLSPTESNGPKQ
jgi:hypothetical protein